MQWNEASSSTHKIKWSPEEDQMLISAVKRYGISSWVKIGSMVPGRSSKQCRERWLGQLSPGVVKTNWTTDEDHRLLGAHLLHGNKWTTIAEMLPGRSAISIKNRWNWLVRHQLPQRYSEQPPPPEFPEDWRREAPPEERPQTKPVIFDPLIIQADLFGDRFREFQATMLTHPATFSE
jgi:hypothetical protein